MTLRLHTLRLEVAAVQWQLLNRDGMNKLSQLSVSVSFTLRVTCLNLFPYMLPNVSI
jgi:hypothetical protein